MTPSFREDGHTFTLGEMRIHFKEMMKIRDEEMGEEEMVKKR